MEGRDASIMSKDIGFLKQVMIKEWYNFPNHRVSHGSLCTLDEENNGYVARDQIL